MRRSNNYLLQKEADNNTQFLLPVLTEQGEAILKTPNEPFLSAPAAAPGQNLTKNFTAAEAGLISAITEESKIHLPLKSAWVWSVQNHSQSDKTALFSRYWQLCEVYRSRIIFSSESNCKNFASGTWLAVSCSILPETQFKHLRDWSAIQLTTCF